MSRFADALKRARGSPIGDDSRPPDAIRLFAPGQPVVVPPWDLDDEAPAPAPDLLKGPWGHRRDAARISEVAADPTAAGNCPPAEAFVPSVSPFAREQYNRLAAAIHQLQSERRLKVVMITSSTPHEGKTVTAGNLAKTLSESYQSRVLLIDADLRRPSLHSLFGTSNARGLSDTLVEWGPPPIVQLTPRLALLTAGSRTSDPIRMLTSDRMRLLIDGARVEFDCVVIDTAPIGLLPDAGLVGSLADGTVLVVRAGSTPREIVHRAAAAVGVDRIIGVVLNGIAEEDVAGGSNYRDYFDAARRQEDGAGKR